MFSLQSVITQEHVDTFVKEHKERAVIIIQIYLPTIQGLAP